MHTKHSINKRKHFIQKKLCLAYKIITHPIRSIDIKITIKYNNQKIKSTLIKNEIAFSDKTQVTANTSTFNEVANSFMYKNAC